MVGRLERVPLRKLWKHEAYDFTTWLFEHLDFRRTIGHFNKYT